MSLPRGGMNSGEESEKWGKNYLIFKGGGGIIGKRR